MSHDFSKEFFADYHAAVFEALGDDAARYNAKIGSILASRWLGRLEALPREREGFKKAMEGYLSGPFRFSETAELSFSDDGAVHLHVTGCDICPGNDILRGLDKKGSCPVSQMLKSALGRSLGDKVEFTGSDKPGPTGECFLRYRIG